MNTNMVFLLELNNGVDFPIRSLAIANNGDTLEQGSLQIRSTSQALIPFEIPLPVLESGTVTQIPQIRQLQVNEAYLSSLKHGLTTEMVLTVCTDGVPVYSWAQQFTLPDRKQEEVESCEK